MENNIVFVHHSFDRKGEEDFFNKFPSLFQLVEWDRRYGHRYYHLSVLLPPPYRLERMMNRYVLENGEKKVEVARFQKDWKGLVHIRSDLNEMQQLVSLYELQYQYLLCPIRQEIMKDPVLLVGDGHSYEREAIQSWLQQHRKTSPLTNESLTDEETRLISNRTLKDVIHHIIMKC